MVTFMVIDGAEGISVCVCVCVCVWWNNFPIDYFYLISHTLTDSQTNTYRYIDILTDKKQLCDRSQVFIWYKCLLRLYCYKFTSRRVRKLHLSQIKKNVANTWKISAWWSLVPGISVSLNGEQSRKLTTRRPCYVPCIIIMSYWVGDLQLVLMD